MISQKLIQDYTFILLDLQKNLIQRLKSYSNNWSGDIFSPSFTLTLYAGKSDHTSQLNHYGYLKYLNYYLSGTMLPKPAL